MGISFQESINKYHEDFKTHVSICSSCGAYGIELPHAGEDYYKHYNCGGVLLISQTTTCEQYKNMSAEQARILNDEIAAFISEARRIDQRSAARREEMRQVAMSNGLMSRQQANKEFGTSEDSAKTVPHCPTCGSFNVRPISTGKRLISTLAWGLGSSNVGKTYECLDCRYKW